MWNAEVQLYILHAIRVYDYCMLWQSTNGLYYSGYFHPLLDWRKAYVCDDYGTLIEIARADDVLYNEGA